MTALKAAIAITALVLAGSAYAETPDECAVPNYLMAGDNPLDKVNAAVASDHKLVVAVVGTMSASLPGPDGQRNSFPSRLEAALKKRLPSVTVTVTAKTAPRQTAADMAPVLEKMLVDDKPTLVVWQTGTYDAVQGVNPEDFRATVADAVEMLQTGGADVVLMNMQYSPRTESMLAVGPYADNLKWVAREREVPVYDRLSIMRYWNENGTIDLYKATKDMATAQRVHDCIGRTLASLIIDAARLEPLEAKAPQ